MFARWIEKEYEIDEFEKIRVVHLKQYIAHQLKMGHKATYMNNMVKILRAFFKYTNGEDYTDIAYYEGGMGQRRKACNKDVF